MSCSNTYMYSPALGCGLDGLVSSTELSSVVSTHVAPARSLSDEFESACSRDGPENQIVQRAVPARLRQWRGRTTPPVRPRH